MFIVHNYWDCWSIAIVDTSAFKFTQRWAANTSSNVYIVSFARAFTATAQYNETRFTSSFKCSPVWQPDTTVLFLPAPFTEVWNFLTNRCFLLWVETSLKKTPFQMLNWDWVKSSPRFLLPVKRRCQASLTFALTFFCTWWRTNR